MKIEVCSADGDEVTLGHTALPDVAAYGLQKGDLMQLPGLAQPYSYVLERKFFQYDEGPTWAIFFVSKPTSVKEGK